VKGGKVSRLSSAREQGRNEGGLLFSGEQAVRSRKILWPGAGRGGCRWKMEDDFFREELGAWGGGEEDPGGCFIALMAHGPPLPQQNGLWAIRACG